VHGRRSVTFAFEAKRLRGPTHLLSQYVGKDGLLLFVTGEYAPDDVEAGMLGYIQDSTVTKWYERLETEVSSPRHVALALIGLPQSLNDRSFAHPITSTRHERKGRPPIRIFHIFLDCV
jgi:hypothetical protein